MSLKIRRDIQALLSEAEKRGTQKFKFRSSLLVDDLIKTPEDTMYEARTSTQDAWVNSEPLLISHLDEDGAAHLFYISERMKKKVVLLDVWDCTLLHSVRSLAYMRELHERYWNAGLVIIGVHSPFFGFGKDKKLLTDAVQALGIRYPVVMDNDFSIWKSLDNSAWPRRVLINAREEIVMDVEGEGRYEEIERAIQNELRALSPGLATPPLLPQLYPLDPKGTDLFFGYRGSARISNPNRPAQAGDELVYRDASRGKQAPGSLWLEGKWVFGEESLYPTLSMVTPYTGEFHLCARARCQDVFVIGGSRAKNFGEAPKPLKAQVLLDDKAVPEENFGRNLRSSDSRRAQITLHEPDLLHVLTRLDGAEHEVKLLVDNDGYDAAELFAMFFIA